MSCLLHGLPATILNDSDQTSKPSYRGLEKRMMYSNSFVLTECVVCFALVSETGARNSRDSRSISCYTIAKSEDGGGSCAVSQ